MTASDKEQVWRPVELPKASTIVYQMLRSRILHQDFAPGERLHLPEIEKQLQVSRTPLKDALTKLESEGLIEIQARRGTFVTPVTAEKLDAAYKIRSAFELYVALCLFKYLNPPDFAFFRQTRNQMDALVSAPRGDWRGVFADYLALDQQLHDRFVERGGPPRMTQLYRQANVHLQVLMVADRYHRDDLDRTHAEHEQIFDALERRSPEDLEHALFNHLENARLRMLKNMRETSR